MFNSPELLVSSLLATFWAAMFHLFFGRRWVDLFLYFLVGMVGFFVGQAMANLTGLRWMMVGQVHLIEGTAACWFAMLIARWLKV